LVANETIGGTAIPSPAAALEHLRAVGIGDADAAPVT
jgi:hypothetical protein